MHFSCEYQKKLVNNKWIVTFGIFSVELMDLSKVHVEWCSRCSIHILNIGNIIIIFRSIRREQEKGRKMEEKAELRMELPCSLLLHLWHSTYVFRRMFCWFWISLCVAELHCDRSSICRVRQFFHSTLCRQEQFHSCLIKEDSMKSIGICCEFLSET